MKKNEIIKHCWEADHTQPYLGSKKTLLIGTAD